MLVSIRTGLLKPVLVLVALHGATTLAHADVFIAVDEFGNSTFLNTATTASTTLPFALQADPGPGGLSSVLTYNLLGPPSLVAGDLLITEPGDGLGDVVRFNPAGTGNPNYPASLLFYSEAPPTDSLADTPVPPLVFYANTLTLAEGAGGAVVYTPTVGEPGFVSGFTVHYDLVSDGELPEPSSWVLLGTVLLSLVIIFRRAHRTRRTV